jgi:ABC-type multidrug transport system fused ATPase/permease subunit
MQQPRDGAQEKNRVRRPTTIGEVPAFVKEWLLTVSFRLRYTFLLVWETKKLLLFVMLFFSVFDGLMPVVGSLISAAIINRLSEVVSNRDLAFSSVVFFLVLQFVYTFVRSTVSRIYNAVLSVTGELVSNHIKLKIMAKAKEIDMVCYDSSDFYASMENASREAGSRPIQVMSSSFSVLSYLISIVSYVIVVFSVSQVASLLIVLVSIPIAVVNFVFRRKNVNYLNRHSKNRRKMDYFSSVVVDKDLAKEIRIFDLSDYFCSLYEESFDEYYKGLKRLKIQENVWSVLASLLSTVVYCLLYIMFARGVYDGLYAVGNFVLYTGAITSIGDGISNVISSTSSIYENTLFINNLIQFLEMKPTIVPSGEKGVMVRKHQPHTIEFRDVRFSYPGNNAEVLKGVSFTIRPNETIAIVGLNGAGKTTIIKLLMRLYDPTSGVILLDGRDIREYDVNDLYSMYGVIFQDFGKYAISVGENIRLSDIGSVPDEGRVVAAAVQSGASAYVSAFESGYDTQLMRYFDTDGKELSLGQWQKLAVARAFYSDSDVLILDEPTASLDPRAEQEIFNQFADLKESKTCVFISHRLSSATIADRILVLKDGVVAESGSHQELMELNGEYAQLFKLQASRYVEGTETTR